MFSIILYTVLENYLSQCQSVVYPVNFPSLVTPCCLLWLQFLPIWNIVNVIRFMKKHSRLRYLQRKESHIDRCGDHASHATSTPLEIAWPGNTSPNTAMDALAVSAVAPSCWKHLPFKLMARRLSLIHICYGAVHEYMMACIPWGHL